MSTPSCGCGQSAVIIQPQNESVASQIDNLILTLLGSVTKTVVNGRATWSVPCSPDDTGLLCIPRGANEGLICYILRLISDLGIYFGGIYDPTKSYCKNTLVSYDDGTGTLAYVALQDVPVGTTPSNASYWQVVVTGMVGPAGPAGNATANTYRRTVTVNDSPNGTATLPLDVVLDCQPGAPINISLPEIADVATLAGKWFIIRTNGAFDVTITPFGTEKINGVNAPITLTVAGESVMLVSDDTDNWIIV